MIEYPGTGQTVVRKDDISLGFRNFTIHSPDREGNLRKRHTGEGGKWEILNNKRGKRRADIGYRMTQRCRYPVTVTS